MVKIEPDCPCVDYDGLRALIDASAENADVFDRLAYLWDDMSRWETHFPVVSDAGKILAAGSVRPNPENEAELWLTHISVDPDYKGQGYGKNILRRIFAYAHDAGYLLAPSSFEKEGLERLAPIMPRLHREFPDLKIRYKTLSGAVVDGSEPYALVHKGGFLAIERAGDAPAVPQADLSGHFGWRAAGMRILSRLGIGPEKRQAMGAERSPG